MSALLALTLTACHLLERPEPSALRLDRMAEAVVSVALPATSRPALAPERFPVLEAFAPNPAERGGEAEVGLTSWRAPLPLHHLPRGAAHRRAPPGMTVLGPGGEPLRYSAAPKPETWGIRGDGLVVRLPEGAAAPEPSAYTILHPEAAARENERSQTPAPGEEVAFALRDMRLDEGTRHGVFLPAPASVRWRLEVPDEAVLELEASLLPPLVEVAGLRSDGATLEVWLEGRLLARQALSPGDHGRMRVVLPEGVSGSAELELRSLPGEAALLDYVFVAHPTVFVPEEAPQRLLLVFVDTLRPDHMSVYGYGRETTPNLARWAAEGGRVFRRAHSVAPWTLPSAKAALSGRQPERWAEGPALLERLSARGWTTAFFSANAWISEQTGLNRGADRFLYRHLASAEHQVEAARDFLEAHPDRDVAVVLHLMDPHLPYREPEPYRRLWAGDAPEALGESSFTRSDLLSVRPSRDGFEEIRRYVVARYDQNIRRVDDALAPLLAALEGHPVVLFSDHGEEFWEHGAVEHGHSVYEEVVRVPLILRAPGLSAGWSDAPASLLDITPTVLALLGLPIPEGLDGRSLLRPLPARRPQAIGRTLYGRDLWALLDGDAKRIRASGGVERYDLAADPAEAHPQPATLDEALEVMVASEVGPVARVWRLSMSGRDKQTSFEGSLTIHHPEGFSAAWCPYDVNGRMECPRLSADGRQVHLEGGGDRRLPGELYLLPRSASPEGLTLTLARDGESTTASYTPGDDENLVSLRFVGYRARIVEDIALLPSADGSGGEEVPDELRDALRALGYLE